MAFIRKNVPLSSLTLCNTIVTLYLKQVARDTLEVKFSIDVPALGCKFHLRGELIRAQLKQE